MYGKERLRGWMEDREERQDVSCTSIVPGQYWQSTCPPYVLDVLAIPQVPRTHIQRRYPARRAIAHAGALVGLLVAVVGTLCIVLPTTSDGIGGFFQPTVAQVSVRHEATVLISAQGATATAVTQDGYEYQGAGGRYAWAGVKRDFTLPDGSKTGVGQSVNPDPVPGAVANTSTGPVASAGTGTNTGPVAGTPDMGTGTDAGLLTAGMSALSSLTGTIADTSFTNQFTSGQCTYWADYEYHRLMGYSIPWSGNASTWASNAAAHGWNVSSVPQMHSIIVLQSGVQGAGWAGHVGVVEGINSDGSVSTTNWNVRGWGHFSRETYWPGAGVSFIWHP